MSCPGVLNVTLRAKCGECGWVGGVESEKEEKPAFTGHTTVSGRRGNFVVIFLFKF